MVDSALLDEILEFMEERDWGQFHSPENLAKSISIEASELLELFQWEPPKDFENVKDELADVLTYCLLLSHKLGSDPAELIRNKLAITRTKYPVEKFKGLSTKYDQLSD